MCNLIKFDVFTNVFINKILALSLIKEQQAFWQKTGLMFKKCLTSLFIIIMNDLQYLLWENLLNYLFLVHQLFMLGSVIVFMEQR